MNFNLTSEKKEVFVSDQDFAYQLKTKLNSERQGITHRVTQCSADEQRRA